MINAYIKSMRALFAGVERAWFGSQVFSSASAFNANIALWHVLRVTTYGSAFTGVGLADCIKRGVYDNWGSTFQTAAASAYPTWSSICAPPTPTPRYSCPSCSSRVSACKRGLGGTD
jgi:hypothetical protein